MSEHAGENDAHNDAHRPNGCCDYHRHIADGCCHCERPARPGDRVRIVADEHPRLVGLEGNVSHLGRDGTTAWVETTPQFGVWCSVVDIDVIPPASADAGGDS